MKAKRVQYAADALKDVADIRIYLRREAGPQIAKRVTARIRAAIHRAKDLPSAGTPRPDYQSTCRFVVADPYVIYYSFDGKTMSVLRVLHRARNRDAEMSDT